MRKTRRNKGGFVKHQTRKQTQVGGQTPGKTNYTFYFAGYDPADPNSTRTVTSFFNTYDAAGNGVGPNCTDFNRLGCPGPRTKAALPMLRDGICDADNNLYMANGYGTISKVDTNGYTSIIALGAFSQTVVMSFGPNNTWPLYTAGNEWSQPKPYMLRRLKQNVDGSIVVDKEYNLTNVVDDNSVRVILAANDTRNYSYAPNGLCCDDTGSLYYTRESNIYKITTPTDLFASHVKMPGGGTGDLDGPVATAQVGTLGRCKYHSNTNSIFFYDSGYNKIKRLNLTTNEITTVSWKWNSGATAKITSLEGPHANCVFSISPTTNILYYIRNDTVAATHGIYTLNIDTGVSKRYSGGGNPITTETLLGFGVPPQPLPNNMTHNAIKSSTPASGSTPFSGNAIHPDNPAFLAVDSNDQVFCAKEHGTGPKIYVTIPSGPAKPPTTLSFTTATGNSVTITWSNDTDASSYEFTITPSGSPLPVVPGTSTTATFTGLQECTLYTISLTARNAAGVAPPKEVSCLTTFNSAVLQTPLTSSVSLLSNPQGIISCLLSWTGFSRVSSITYTLTPILAGPSGPTGASRPTGPTAVDLPAGWFQRTDPSSGRLYYFREGSPSTWDFPGKGPQPELRGTLPNITSPHTITELEPNVTYRVTIVGRLTTTATSPVPTAGNGIYSVMSNSVRFTTKPVLPVYMGTLVGQKSNSLGPLKDTTFTFNRGIVQDNANNIYISSSTCIYKLTPPANTTYHLFDTSQEYPTPVRITNPHVGLPASTISLFAGSSTETGVPSGTKTGSSIRFYSITGMTYYGDALYVTDSTNNLVIKITTGGTPTATVIEGSSFSEPRDIIRGIGTDTNLYIADCQNNCISVLNTGTNAITKLRTSSSETLSVPNPASLVQHPDGSFYVACTSNHTIQKLTPSASNPGTYSMSLFAGVPDGHGNTNGPNLSAKFASPNGLALDSANNLYVYDSANFSIRIIIGQVVYTYLGGEIGNTDGPASSAKFKGNSGGGSLGKLFFDKNNNLYLSDTANRSLRAIANYPVDQVITDTQLTNYRASAAQASSAVIQRASSAVAQVASSAVAEVISGARESLAVAQVASSAVAQVASSAVAQVASSALAQSISGAQASSAVAQVASSALAEAISGARESSAVAQVASSALAEAISGARQSSAVAQQASSALAQSISGAEASSATAQQASSALAQSISGAQASSAVAQVASSALAEAISGARESSAVAQVASSALAEAISGARESSAVAQQASSALAQSISGAEASSAVAQQASSALAQSISGARQSSAVAQVASSALAEAISGARESSAVAQVASSALAEAISGARESSAVAQVASSALAEAISGARESSAVAQKASSSLAQSISGAEASSATAQQASSALAQSISGAEASSAVAQQASSALAQSISGAQASSAVAQVASSAVAEAISGARESSAVAQVASSALAEAISGAQASSALAEAISEAQASSAVAQVASSALAQRISGAEESYVAEQVASSALAQSISGARESSAVAQVASSALAQSISGARQSSAVAQQVSSALAQAISGARESSAVAQQASSALDQAISGAHESSAVAQQASSAVAQVASSALAQSISGAQASSAVAQVASQAVASSALRGDALAAAISIKDDIKNDVAQVQQDIATAVRTMYDQETSTVSGSTLADIRNKLNDIEERKRDLLNSATSIFQLNPNYQDSSLQTPIQDSNLSRFGVTKVFDALRNRVIFLDSNKNIVVSPYTPSTRIPESV